MVAAVVFLNGNYIMLILGQVKRRAGAKVLRAPERHGLHAQDRTRSHLVTFEGHWKRRAGDLCEQKHEDCRTSPAEEGRRGEVHDQKRACACTRRPGCHRHSHHSDDGCNGHGRGWSVVRPEGRLAKLGPCTTADIGHGGVFRDTIPVLVTTLPLARENSQQAGAHGPQLGADYQLPIADRLASWRDSTRCK